MKVNKIYLKILNYVFLLKQFCFLFCLYNRIYYSFLFLLGLIQGLIGWWMVRSGLINNPYVDHLRLATHLFMAQTILMIISFLILKKIFPGNYNFTNKSNIFKYQFLIFFILTSVTVIYGAFMAGMDAGKSYNTWPLMGGELIPNSLIGNEGISEFYSNSVFVHFFHRILAYLTFILGACIFLSSRNYISSKFQMIHLVLIEIVILIQILLGVLTVLYAVPVLLGALHQLTGSILLMLTATYTFSLFQKK